MYIIIFVGVLITYNIYTKHLSIVMGTILVERTVDPDAAQKLRGL